jgi:hypothetical protein
MMGKFTHYLITRFNVKIDGLGPELFPASARTPDWEATRLQLFTQYCAASVNGQSNRNFTWLLCCDPDSSSGLLEGIRHAIANGITYEIMLVRDFSEMLKQLKTKCNAAPTDFVITTRLDNDDGISRDFIQAIQSNFNTEHNTIINLLGGVHYQQDKGIFTHLRYSAKNSFMSLVENKSTGIQTVLAFKHLTPGDDKRIINVPVRFAFWMTLHDQNAAQRMNLGWPIFPGTALSHYAIDKHLVRTSIYNTVSYFTKWFPRAASRKLYYIFFKKNNRKNNTATVSFNQHQH